MAVALIVLWVVGGLLVFAVVIYAHRAPKAESALLRLEQPVAVRDGGRP